MRPLAHHLQPSDCHARRKIRFSPRKAASPTPGLSSARASARPPGRRAAAGCARLRGRRQPRIRGNPPSRSNGDSIVKDLEPDLATPYATPY
jgi:hypothetical protein